MFKLQAAVEFFKHTDLKRWNVKGLTMSNMLVLTVQITLSQLGNRSRWDFRKEERVSPLSDRWYSASQRPSTCRHCYKTFLSLIYEFLQWVKTNLSNTC